MNSQTKVDTVTRIDKWLWAARFYKTRSKAKAAVVGGRVHVNGSRVKAAYDVRIGDLLSMTRDHFKEEFVVRNISDKRQSANIAQNLYEETVSSKERRETTKQQRLIMQASLIKPKSKPNKADRRELIRLKNSADWRD